MMKKITRRSFLTVCGAVAAAAALSACGGSASSTTASSAAASSTAASSVAASAAGDLSGNVATGGSTSMKNVIAALTEGFAEVQPGVTVSYDPTGSGAGITGATDKTLDIGLSSRALKADETGVTGTTIALDGIAIIVNKDSKVEDLTVDQLKQMFTGEITNWSEVGGDDGEIVLVGREAGSGTRDGFESIVDVKDACKYAQELTATGAVISAVEANPWPSATLPCLPSATPSRLSPWRAWSAVRIPSRTAPTRSSARSSSSPTIPLPCPSRRRHSSTLPPARTLRT